MGVAKMFIGVMVLCTLLLSSEVTSSIKNINQGYCQPIKSSNTENKEFCMEYNISYPHFTSTDTALATRMNQAVKEHLGLVNAKKYVEDYLKEVGEDTWLNNHSEETTIELFSLTPKTFTLSVATSSYSGGAHGNFAYQAYNYDRSSGKKITLDDIFTFEYKQSLQRIAERVYRKSVGITPHDDLSATQGWFENKFILPQSIGLGKEGLYLFYTPYEIKPYAAGTTEFTLPYSQMAELIHPDMEYYPLFEKALKNAKQDSGSMTKLFKSSQGSLKLELTPQANRQVRVIATVEGFSDFKAGGLSLSLPQLHDEKLIHDIGSDQVVAFKLYKAGTKLFHLPTRKAIRSRYLLLEADTSSWYQLEAKKTFSFVVTLPSELNQLLLHARLAFRQNRNIIKFPSDGIEGQQGFRNYEVTIPLTH